MGTELHYKPGSFYRICQRTGFATRAENTRREWQGLFVRREVFEYRQPQDFVRGVADKQTVPYPLPRPTDVFSATLPASFEVSTNGSGVQCFNSMGGQINVYTGIASVDPSNYPKSF